MCWTKRKVWYQCRHETVDRGVCDKARRTGSACPADKWSYERLEYFGGTNIPCEHADCVKWNRRLAEMRQEALERNLTDATRHRMGLRFNDHVGHRKELRWSGSNIQVQS